MLHSPICSPIMALQSVLKIGWTLNPLLHRLYLDNDNIFYFQTTMKKFKKKKISSVLNTFENIMENGALAPKEQMLHFP